MLSAWISTLTLALAFAGAHAVQDTPALDCRPAMEDAAALREMPEASGVAVSRRDPSRAWVINDSGEPILYAADQNGRITASVRVPGATVTDWEDVEVAPCPGGSCVYIGDIGDNDARRQEIVVYRIPEPAADARSTAAATQFRATYPDGPRDAEALVVAGGRIYVIAKGSTSDVRLYRFPRNPKAGTVSRLEPVGGPLGRAPVDKDDQITGAAVSSDGKRVAVRTHKIVRFFPVDSFLKGAWRETARVDVSELGEPQGEGIAFGPDNTLLLTGEGGGRSEPGTFWRLSCPAIP